MSGHQSISVLKRDGHSICRFAIVLAWFLAICSLAQATPTINTPSATPSSIPAGTATVVTFTASITDPSITTTGINLQQLGANGSTFTNIGTLYDDGTHGDAVAGDQIFSLQLSLNQPTPYPVIFRVSAPVKGSLTRIFSSLISVNVTGNAPALVTLTSPPNLAFENSSPVTVSGTVTDPSATVTVNGLPAPISGGSFTLSVPIQEGNNILTASALNSQGTVTTSSVQVTLDTTPPRISIDTPYDGYATTDTSITVSGKANDTVVGTVNSQQVSVTVNGVAATVANRSFQALNVPLALGSNTILVSSHDRAGNGATSQITVRRDNPTQSIIKIVSGSNQTGAVGAVLSNPIVAGVVDGAGNPVSGQVVVFTVTQNNGTLDSSGTVEAVTTDASGHAQARWKIGTRSGAGNNIVEATAVGFADSAIFTASGTPGSPGQVSLDAGNDQMGAVGQPLPYPLVVVVTDSSHNRLVNVPVTFAVKQGGGKFGGQTTVTTNSDSDGRAAAVLTLGPNDGIENNVVEANFASNTGFPAAFSASGHVPGNPAATKISGVVLDNSNNPVPGATIRVYLQNIPAQQSGGLPPAITAQSDLQGQFIIQPAPVGFVKIIADGSTVTLPGKWPNLEYDLVTVSGQNNIMELPIYLLPIDTQHQLCLSDTQGGTLTVPALPGFSLSVLPGAATFPGGSKTGCVSVTEVHPDKIPMVPSFGQQPGFIVTVQPAGTLFSPPATVTIPNAEGLAAREVTEMYSFDHDLAAFVTVGSATVSDDGSVVRADPGVGILKAGWFSGGPPTPVGCVAVCGPCRTCNGSSCAADQLQNGNSCTLQSGFGACNNGSCMAVTPTLTQVTFSGSNFHNVAQDSNGAPYGTPQWTSVGNQFPVSYTMNTAITVAAQFTLSSSVTSSNVTVIGSGPGGLRVQGSGTVSGTTITFPATAFSGPLPNVINKYNSFQIAWQVSLDGAATYSSAGTSTNKMYVTLADPGSNAIPLYETILDIGTRNAVGQSTAAGAVAPIWSNFKSLAVTRADGVQMGYWTNGTDTCQSLSLMLADPGGNGSCIAWAQLLYQTFEAEGITGAAIYEITPDTTANPKATNFMVKNWSFDKHVRTGPDGIANSTAMKDDIQLVAVGQSAPNMSEITPGANGKLDSLASGDDTVQDGLFIGTQYPYLLYTGVSVFGPYGDRSGDVARYPIGIAGQRNNNPPPLFHNHWIVECNPSLIEYLLGNACGAYQFSGPSLVWDPSYGAGPFSSELAHKDAAIDGINSGMLANKNITGTQLLVYTHVPQFEHN